MFVFHEALQIRNLRLYFNSGVTVTNFMNLRQFVHIRHSTNVRKQATCILQCHHWFPRKMMSEE